MCVLLFYVQIIKWNFSNFNRVSLFVGKPNLDEKHPDYVPNVFPFSKGKIRSAANYEIHKRRHDKILKKQQEVKKQTENCVTVISGQPEIATSGNFQIVYWKKYIYCFRC